MGSHSQQKAGPDRDTESVDRKVGMSPALGAGLVSYYGDCAQTNAQTNAKPASTEPVHGGVRIIEQEARNMGAHIETLQRMLQRTQDSRAVERDSLREMIDRQAATIQKYQGAERVAAETAKKMQKVERDVRDDSSAHYESWVAISNQIRQPGEDCQLRDWPYMCGANQRIREVQELQRTAARWQESRGSDCYLQLLTLLYANNFADAKAQIEGLRGRAKALDIAVAALNNIAGHK